MSSIRLYVAALLVLLSLSAQAQTEVWPLDTVLNRISQNNGMLQEIEFRAKAQNAMAKGARSQMAPMVGAGVFMQMRAGGRRNAAVPA